MKRPLRIMGLDPSLNATGVSLSGNRVMTIKCKPVWGDTRLCVIRDTIRRLLPEVDLVAMEDKVHNSYSAAIMGMVQGVIRTELMDKGVPYVLIPAKTVKKFATGNGNADKALMISAARELAGLDFHDDNQCDAWHIRNVGLYLVGQPDVAYPADRVACLSSIVTPEGFPRVVPAV